MVQLSLAPVGLGHTHIEVIHQNFCQAGSWSDGLLPPLPLFAFILLGLVFFQQVGQHGHGGLGAGRIQHPPTTLF